MEPDRKHHQDVEAHLGAGSLVGWCGLVGLGNACLEEAWVDVGPWVHGDHEAEA